MAGDREIDRCTMIRDLGGKEKAISYSNARESLPGVPSGGRGVPLCGGGACDTPCDTRRTVEMGASNDVEMSCRAPYLPERVQEGIETRLDGALATGRCLKFGYLATRRSRLKEALSAFLAPIAVGAEEVDLIDDIRLGTR